MNEGVPPPTRVHPMMDRGTLNHAAHRDVIHLIARYAVFISVAYGMLYVALGFHLLALKTAVLSMLYVGVLGVARNPKVPIRPLSVGFMFVALIHTVTLGLLFLPTATGLHFWVLVVPFFCLITLHKRDWFFAGLFSAIACSCIVFLEWHREGYRPLFEVALSSELTPYIRAFSIFGVVLFVSCIFWSYHRSLARARQEAHEAFERSESLLLNILPVTIAERLKNNEAFIADDIKEASVLFCDLVGFTDLASKQTALQTVQMLNGIFWAFDQAIERRGLEKIKTIGDAYMVASGVPHARKDHADSLIGLAQDFFDIVNEYNLGVDYNLKLRIGIHSGPLTAGVIGKNKFSYDLWGDTVNVASRMESTGIPDRIQVSAEFVDATRGQFEFEPREDVYIKGKGDMTTFLVA